MDSGGGRRVCGGAGDVCQETAGRGRETAHHTVHTHAVLVQLPY